MSNIYRIIVVLLFAVLVVSCTTPYHPTPLPSDPSTEPFITEPNQSVLPEIEIVRYPEPLDLSKNRIYASPPVYDPRSEEQWQVDLRSSDLTKLDLSKSGTIYFTRTSTAKLNGRLPIKCPTTSTGKKSSS